MDHQIRVIICAGTACHVMGGSELFLVGERLDPSIRNRVVIEGETCLDLCRLGAPGTGPGGGAPYALVDGTIVERADIETLAAAIMARAAPHQE